MPSRAFEDARFAVVDVETTGIHFSGHDRIVEIAVLTADGAGGAPSEFTTLVNPERDVGPTHLHGVTAGDVLNAPRFGEIAGTIFELLEDRIIVGHNARFDLQFLRAESGRLGFDLPIVPMVCTLRLSDLTSVPSMSRRLGDCCDAVGVEVGRLHSALDDARATWALLTSCLAVARGRGLQTLKDIGCTGAPPETWPRARPTRSPLPRDVARTRESEGAGYLRRLVASLPMSAAGEGALEYSAVLDRAMEDRRLTADEVDALEAAAALWDLSRETVVAVHRSYLRHVATAAISDGEVSESEQRDLEAVANLLGFSPADVDQALLEAPRIEGRLETGPQDEWRGKTVCFTGAFSATLNGERINRAQAEALAIQAGLQPVRSVTKKLDVLVAADPNTLSGKGKKARQYGIRTMAEPAFWQAIGVRVG